MDPKPDEQRSLSQAATAVAVTPATEPAIPGTPAPSAAPVRTDADTGEMWIQL